MGVAMSTLVGWAVVIAVAGFFLHRGHGKSRRTVAKKGGQKQKEDQRIQLQARRESKEREKESKVRRRLVEGLEKDSQATKPKSQQHQPPQTSYSKAAAGSSSGEDDNDREFAKQLSDAKQGTTFKTKTKDDVRHKSVKQSRAEEAPYHAFTDDHKDSAPSSTTGIDADDDQSSVATSPLVGAVHAAGDVSDMLEKSAPGPSILRLTGTEEKKPKAKGPKAPAEPAETKKQRQRRKQAEAAKAAGLEAEADRKVRMEAQRRLARQSEGRAAKDGSGFMAAQAKGNVWTGNNGPVNGGSNGTNGFLPVQPLDTSELTAGEPASASAPAPVPHGDSWMSSLPSEEEQMEMLRGEEAWSTVKTRARKAKKKDSPAESNDEAGAPTATPQYQEKSVDLAGIDAAPAAAQDGKRPGKAFTHKSSFAALSADGTTDQDEEEEWDV